jgi:transcriptional regulator with XRE-family HTH domain
LLYSTVLDILLLNRWSATRKSHMEVKDQLRHRMNGLGISVKELSERLGVSGQTVRHWLSGRSFPGKSIAPALEKALSFKLDYTQGAGANLPTATEREDIEGFLAIRNLPVDERRLIYQLAAALNRDKAD